MILNNYLKLLFEEFKNSNFKIENQIDELNLQNKNKLYTLFLHWLQNKETASYLYAKFLENSILKDEEKLGIIKLDQGILNTVTNNFNNINNILIVSPYANTFKDESLKKYSNTYDNNQKLFNCDIVKFLKLKSFNNAISTIITQLPANNIQLEKIKILLKFNKTIVVGSFGNTRDYDKQKKFGTLCTLANDLKNDGIQVESYTANDGNYYQETIKILKKEK